MKIDIQFPFFLKEWATNKVRYHRNYGVHYNYFLNILKYSNLPSATFN